MASHKDLKSGSLKIWKPTKTGLRSEAERRIQSVFTKLLDRRVLDITPDDLAEAMVKYKSCSGRGTDNGQTQKTRLYLMPVMDWATGRGKFGAAGNRRLRTLKVSDLRDTIDPASDDPTIQGTRDRVLDQEEMATILPLLKYPAPRALNMKIHLAVDLRPTAIRFILLTGARLNEVAFMQWTHVDFEKEEWFKPTVASEAKAPCTEIPYAEGTVLTLCRILTGQCSCFQGSHHRIKRPDSHP